MHKLRLSCFHEGSVRSSLKSMLETLDGQTPFNVDDVLFNGHGHVLISDDE